MPLPRLRPGISVVMSLACVVVAMGTALAAPRRLDLASPDRAALAAEDDTRLAVGEPYRFAWPADLDIDPLSAADGWTGAEPGTATWQCEVVSSGCLSLNFGFDRFRLPWGARLTLRARDGSGPVLVYTAADNNRHGQLWTPVLLTDAVVLSLTVPDDAAAACDLHLARVGRGYRYFGEPVREKVGACNIDVVCPEGDGWREEIRSVGVYTVAGAWKCTGAMINNTARDGRPYFLTANHCISNPDLAPEVVVYWNYESPVCGELGGGSLAEHQSGATLRATYATSDVTLLELDAMPDADFRVTYAGWDATDTTPSAAVTIHQPNTDEKCISFENDPLTVTNYLLNDVPGNGTHLRITDWDLGTTEPGSSGSPLFDPQHHIVGQLHGGYAACGNDLSDWYGRFFVSWTGGGDAASRLRDWLDPLALGVTSLDLSDPDAGLAVIPVLGMEASGDPGGPFAPALWTYRLANTGSASLVYNVTSDSNWVDITGGSGTLAVGDTIAVDLALASTTADLPLGVHRTAVTFANLTDSVGTTTRMLQVQVGERSSRYSVDLASDPGWSRGTEWAYGQPQGLGSGGVPDPSSGHTGSNVFGNNLAGDYPPDLTAASSLTAGPFDCRGLRDVQLRFWRWLGVEASPHDHATVAVSADGVHYATVWTNIDPVADTAWTEVAYDISAVADDEAGVMVRWSLGPTNGTVQSCGWNIDDVAILAFGTTQPPLSPRAVLHGLAPNPGGPATAYLQFTLPAAGRAWVTIYDLRGRFIARLGDDVYPAGDQEIGWNLRDATGRRVASGTYVCRLHTAGGESTAPVTIVH